MNNQCDQTHVRRLRCDNCKAFVSGVVPEASDRDSEEQQGKLSWGANIFLTALCFAPLVAYLYVEHPHLFK